MFDILFVGISSVAAVVFSLFLIVWILKKPEGTEKMKEVAGYIREGAASYLKQQYKIVNIFFIVVFFILFFMATKRLLVIFLPFAFLTGGIWSAVCGWIGMYVATRSNSRCAWATKRDLNSGLRVAFSAGTVMGFMVVGLGLLYLLA